MKYVLYNIRSVIGIPFKENLRNFWVLKISEYTRIKRRCSKFFATSVLFISRFRLFEAKRESLKISQKYTFEYKNLLSEYYLNVNIYKNLLGIIYFLKWNWVKLKWGSFFSQVFIHSNEQSFSHISRWDISLTFELLLFWVELLVFSSQEVSSPIKKFYKDLISFLPLIILPKRKSI